MFFSLKAKMCLNISVRINLHVCALLCDVEPPDWTVCTLTGCRSLTLTGSSLTVNSRSSCVLRYGMLHICGERCIANELCTYRRECNYHIIAQSISMWLFRMIWGKKENSASGRYSLLFSDSSSLEKKTTRGEALQACRRADLTERLKAWHFETIGWAA